MEFTTASYTVPTESLPELSKFVGKILANYTKQSTPSEQWEALDIPTLFGTIPEEAKTLIAHLRGYDKGLLHSKSKGVTLSTLADILSWSVNKVNGMMSPIARMAAQMGKGAVISRSGEMLRLSEDFYKAYSDYNENASQTVGPTPEKTTPKCYLCEEHPTTTQKDGYPLCAECLAVLTADATANSLKWADPSWNITAFKKERGRNGR
jgi:hypothetical protein